MLKNIKQKLEKWAVSTLYNQSFNQYHGRINKKKRKIIFDMFGAGLFTSFINSKQRLAISVLINWYGYRCYEYNLLIPFSKNPPKRIKHTWGEIQDIIRSYNNYTPIIRINASKPKKLLPTDIDTVAPFIGSGLQNIEAEQCARALVSHLVSCKKTFEDDFTLADMGNITFDHMRPLVERDCVVVFSRNAKGTATTFKVTTKFIDIVSKFNKNQKQQAL